MRITLISLPLRFGVRALLSTQFPDADGFVRMSGPTPPRSLGSETGLRAPTPAGGSRAGLTTSYGAWCFRLKFTDSCFKRSCRGDARR